MAKKDSLHIVIIALIVILFGGYFISKKMTRGMRNNNPFNLRTSNSKWIGKVGVDDKGFVIFDSLTHGVRAGVINLTNGYFKKGLSIKQIIAKYAPAEDNNDESAYVKNIVKMSDHFNADYVPVSAEDFLLVCKAIVRVEQGFDAVSFDMINSYVVDLNA